jgi:hypothetical protein
VRAIDGFIAAFELELQWARKQESSQTVDGIIDHLEGWILDV